MTLFDKNGKPHHDADSGTTGYQGGGVDDLSQLTRQRTLTTKILEEIVDYGNLNRAYKQVSAKRGSGGIDKMDTRRTSSMVRETYQYNAQGTT
ncbi:MAG: hypothetical protein U5L09_19885 [Bacteroidales bacterium]|nr:hypothetical protein [Bacteroidales bacterium]